MQYHFNGFRPGDPDISDAAPGREAGQGDLPDTVDVLIVGAGPAGLTLAAQLAAFPEIRTRIVERRSGPLEKGQADGISCRSMEMFNAFGFAEKVLKQGYWVNETTFWKPDPGRPGSIVRNGRIEDVEEGLSEMPHMILNQARVHDMYLEIMAKSASRLVPDYGLEFVDLEIDEAAGDCPVKVTLERQDGDRKGEVITVRARYVVGSDGARSGVRKAIGRELVGDSANQAWGVMDVLAVTDFPDIRCKTLIQSENEGNIIVIPREGGYLTRLYIELDKLSAGERVASRNIGIDQLIAAAQRILHPYSFDVREVAWWSVYEIGQRLTDKFDDVPHDEATQRLPRVFITGDACHTHSPKAGQGMNVSMGDAFNLGWKLVSVLTGRCEPDILHSYSAERQAVAQDLIAFDREWSRIMSERPEQGDGENGEEPRFQRYFIQHGRYTAGMSVTYTPSVLTGSDAWQDLATGFEIGTRFHSAPVVRLTDAKAMELGHTLLADARWRLYAFAPHEDPTLEGGRIRALCRFLAGAGNSPVRTHTPAGEDIDAIIDVRAVFQQDHRKLALEAMPEFLLPRKGKLGLIDYEKMFCPDPRKGDIFEMRGIDRQRGCLLVVRPDQYVAHVLPIDAYDELAGFFAGFMRVVPK
ncbi:FAD-binding monooxygenase [Pelagibacterium halotolerans]|uniref:2-polyprenyl-6-methoxyphenol hydroxylase-related FAD-dependent oxidoreductase n=1 Tax=Pelagibacterium halotolerans (strain DSM 22347 / JCM 15775 / CGMCC 1.7692 / B2) TaxID=1082931 RepID=G4RGQ2_PELHB|nr:FAD-binding monooxygenase [Pelagibacterium halotolerans]AEQ52091.1 2-polyprenyl-6-methoxyphenol hydroxylase-related FAD-dependent oxidoreductase [Pelagibacterium halotolerans B2]QJR18137.1 3-hydroxybenzoate 4-monooxygenase [Pelagibacterium halotolerans]SDZ83271.1 phenol 2-monooxygenase [Pelagibacterium halotolerans]